MNKLLFGIFIFIAISLAFGMLYFANGNISFLRPYIPIVIYDNFDLNLVFALLFFGGIIGVTFKGSGYE